MAARLPIFSIAASLFAGFWRVAHLRRRGVSGHGRRRRTLDAARLQGASGAIHPILRTPGKTLALCSPRWSASPGCYQLKSAMAWYDLFEIPEDRKFVNAYEAALTRRWRTTPIFFPASPNCEKVMDRLHAYCYFLEGLMPVLHLVQCAARVRARDCNRAAALSARDRAAVRSLGCVRAIVPRSIVTAKRCAHPAGLRCCCRRSQGAAAFQLESDDPRIAGGFGFGRKTGQPLPFVNPVSTAFCVQALALWSDRQDATRSRPASTHLSTPVPEDSQGSVRLGSEDLIPGAIEHMQAIFPEFPLDRRVGISARAFPLDSISRRARSFARTSPCAAGIFRDKQVRLSAVILQPRMPYWRMRLIGFLISPRTSSRSMRTTGHFMLRPRSAGTIVRHLLWRTRNFFVWEFSPGGAIYTFLWRLAHPIVFGRHC